MFSLTSHQSSWNEWIDRQNKFAILVVWSLNWKKLASVFLFNASLWTGLENRNFPLLLNYHISNERKTFSRTSLQLLHIPTIIIASFLYSQLSQQQTLSSSSSNISLLVCVHLFVLVLVPLPKLTIAAPLAGTKTRRVTTLVFASVLVRSIHTPAKSATRN